MEDVSISRSLKNRKTNEGANEEQSQGTPVPSGKGQTHRMIPQSISSTVSLPFTLSIGFWKLTLSETKYNETNFNLG